MPDELDTAIRAAWAVTMDISGPDDAVALHGLVASVQDCADRRTGSSIAECARRFDVISVWSASSDPQLAERASAVAARLRSIAIGRSS